MEPLDEPKGWRKLQTMAQNEKDPLMLASIIDRMNRLLDQHERKAPNREASARMLRRHNSDNSTELSPQI